MNRRRFLTALCTALSVGATAADAAAQRRLRVVTSTTDLYDIARAVGGSRITATHISEGYQDPHFVEAKPSFVLHLRNADVFAYVGLGLEIGWMPLLLDGARNARINMGGRGNVDVSRVIPVLDVARGNVDRSQGDIHPLGNPHYWLDPNNAKRIAQLFRDKFSELDPGGADDYARNAAGFEARLDSAAREWTPLLARIRGQPVVGYHTSWRYLAEYTGMNIVGFMEPKPGVPPSPSHLAGLVQTMKRTRTKVILMEPWYSRRDADFVARNTGAKVLVVPPSVGGQRGLDDYVEVMDNVIRQLATALQ
jgi:zinc/manganese transport system substrate-binding protein